MYAKSIRPSAKREVQKERSAKRDDQIARSNLRAMRICPPSGQIFYNIQQILRFQNVLWSKWKQGENHLFPKCFPMKIPALYYKKIITILHVPSPRNLTFLSLSLKVSNFSTRRIWHNLCNFADILGMRRLDHVCGEV